MSLAIITGVSSGLGKSIAEHMLAHKIHVIGVSRTNDNSLQGLAEKHHVTYKHYAIDLAQGEQLDQLIHYLKDDLLQWPDQAVYLINNAATLLPMNQAHQIKRTEIEEHYKLNVTAPIALMNSLLQASIDRKNYFVGVNITSGAAERGISGWSAYCSSKAAINMYTETVALEQEQWNREHRIIAFSPGIMDTAMQAQIRATSRDQFPTRDVFRQYKANEQLVQPKDVALALFDILSEPVSIKSGHIYRAADYLRGV